MRSVLSNFFSSSLLRSLGFVCRWILNAYKVFNYVLTKVGMLREAEICDLFSVICSLCTLSELDTPIQCKQV